MDVGNVKTGLFELPVVFIYQHSSLSQSKRSWSSTILVAVQNVEQYNPHGCVEKETEKFVQNESDTCLCAGILPPPQFSKNEQYAKDLIDQNKGIVEVGASWPACERKPSRLHIVWHDKNALFNVNSRQREQATHAPALPFILLIGARYVEAFNVYNRQRQLLMSSTLPLPEQQVAYEVKLLLSHIMKNLQSHLQFNISSTKDDVEEPLLINIMNILVEVQLSDDKKETEPSLLAESGDLIAFGDSLRIVRHKVLSDLVTLVQSVLAFRSPSKDSVGINRLDEGDEGKECAGRILYMRRAVLDIIELMKHMSQAGGSCLETHSVGSNPFNFRGKHEVGGEKISNCMKEQIIRIQWKMLLAVLNKKDPVSLENILCSIHDEDKRQLVEIMAWSLGLVENCDEEFEKKGALAITDRRKKAGLECHGPGVCEVNVESSDGISGEHLQVEGMKQGDTCASTRLADHALESVRANEIGGQPIFEPFQEHAEVSCVPGQGARGWDGGHSECKDQPLLQEHPKERCIQGQGAGDKENDLVITSPSHTHQLQAVWHTDKDVDPSRNKGDSAGESPSHTHQLQAAMPQNHDMNPSSGSGGLQIVSQAALETTVDSHVPDYASAYVVSGSQPIASSDEDHLHNDVKASKGRHRKRRKHKPYRLKEDQNLPCSPHFQHEKSQSPVRKLRLVVTMAFILGATAMGIFWFQTDFSSHPITRQHRAFARGYLP